MKKCNFFPSVLATVLLFSLPLLLLIGCSTDNNEKIPTEPSTNENLLPYQNEVIIAGI
jgi:hypothetical protein